MIRPYFDYYERMLMRENPEYMRTQLELLDGIKACREFQREMCDIRLFKWMDRLVDWITHKIK